MLSLINKKQFAKTVMVIGNFCLSILSNAQPVTPPNPYPTGTPVSYIRTWDATAPEIDGNILITRPLKDVKQTTQYLDGLGRPFQSVIKQGSSETDPLSPTSSINATDMIRPAVYDEFGRETYKYLPFAANSTGGYITNDGAFKPNPFQQQATFMTSQYGSQGENYFYSKTDFEASPLNRVQESYAPGNNWVGSESNTNPNLRRRIQMKYWTNTSTDDVKKWNVIEVLNSWGTYALAGTYSAGDLYKNVIVDEHGKQGIEFKDKEGKIILKKVQLTATADDGTGRDYTGWLSTYYIYDDINNLRCVIQPQAVKLMSSAINWDPTPYLDEYCFRYEYDERNRMVMKKVPGTGNVNMVGDVYMVYDARDRLVMSQDANQRTQGKWKYTLYDKLNRPISTGLWDNTQDRLFHKGQASTSTSYPDLNGQTYEELTTAFYDNYDWRSTYGNPLTNIYDNNPEVYFQLGSNTWPYSTNNVQSNQLKGMATGSRVKVLGTSVYLYTVIFYDEKGKVIQVLNQNITLGTDIVTTQYTWSGQPLVIVEQKEKLGTNGQTSTVVSQLTYDELGRFVKSEKKASNTLVNGGVMPTVYKTIAQIEYDKLGQLKKKTLSPTGGANGSPLETLNFDYNIRGWMLGMNRNYLATTGQSGTTKFGFELGYDNLNNSSGHNFTAAQFNGNISGMIWKTDGDDVKRKYDFSYDPVNRLMKGAFEQDNATATWNNTTMDYSVQMGNGTDPTSAYDANGNIQAMKQYGWKIGQPTTTPIDNLTYNYKLNGLSNQLLNVIDAANDVNTRLGDFRQSTLYQLTVPVKTTTTVDYTYDANGNLTTDFNKDIFNANGADGIQYNYLNLPSAITVKKDAAHNKGTITYIYDAAGNILKKTVLELAAAVLFNGNIITSDITTTTTYLDGFVYESKMYSEAALASLAYPDKLQFLGHDEGRVRFKEAAGNLPASLQYDYMLKDHLGNVRMVLTEEQQQDVYPAATLEKETYNGGTAISIESQFYDIDNSKIVKSVTNNIPTYQNNNGNPPYNNNPYSNTTAYSDYLYKLNSTNNTNADKNGLGIVLKVMAGDNVNIFGKSYHKMPSGGGYTAPINGIVVSELINAFANTNIVSSHGVTAGSQITGQAGFPTTMSGLVGNQPAQTSSMPRAAINWIILDDQFKYVTGGFDMVGDDVYGIGVLKSHGTTIPTIPILRNGYIYVYCSNESQYDVFFDNLQVIHTRGPILEETHFYPFGLTMSGISSKALNFGNPENKIKLSGKELQSNEFADGSGLEYYDLAFRTLSQQIGRFMQIDPLSENFYYNSTYAYAENRVINGIDLEGLEYYYTSDGKLLGNVGKSQDVYLADGVTTSKDKNGTDIKEFTNPRALNVSNTDFLRFAAIIMKEDLTERDASFGIASSLVNYSNFTGKSIHNLVNGRYSTTNHSSFKVDNTNADKTFAISAVINALTGGHDYSNGAVLFDGVDLAGKGFNHIKLRTMGAYISQEHFDAFKAAWPNKKLSSYSGGDYTSFSSNFSAGVHFATEVNAGRVLLRSVAVVGSTLFYGANADYSYTIPTYQLQVSLNRSIMAHNPTGEITIRPNAGFIWKHL